jgi:brefeldin A-inhibited guanine nucleotide-exchange protein
MVNGLLKTAQGPPAGTPTSLVPPQDTTMKSEAMKCLVSILRSMGDWMNKQLRIPDPDSPKVESEQNDNDGGNEFPQTENNGDASSEVSDSHSELSNGVSEAASLEQRRAYKMELQVNLIPHSVTFMHFSMRTWQCDGSSFLFYSPQFHYILVDLFPSSHVVN